MRVARPSILFWLLATAAISLPFLIVAATNLENFRPLSDDEALIMSASYKLSRQGVLGSDLYTGLLRGDEHYFFNLPAHHYVQAAVFALWRAGIAEARWPSLAAAAVVIWTTSWLAFRWYGLASALVASLVLVAWRSDLVGLHPGLPLLGLARSGRYDLAALAWSVLSLALLDRLVEKPGRGTAILVGICAGLATLTQFFGAFVLPVIAIVWWRHVRGRPNGVEIAAWMTLGAGLLIIPYAIDALRHRDEWIGQNFLVRHAGRASIGSAAFYVDNLVREPQRFAHLFRSPAWSSPLLAGAVAAAVAHLVARLRSHRRACDEILACSLAVPAGGLAAIESTKAPLYAVALLPALCLLIAPTLVRAAQWCGAPDRRRPLRAAALAGLMAVAGTIATDALRAYRIDRRESREASRYVDAGRRIESLVPPAATVLGPHRWWWALRDRKYRSLPGLWWQWRLAGAANNPQLADAIAASSARYLIVNDDIRSEIASHPELLQQQFRAVLDRSVLVAAWDDRSYSSTEIYAITPSADARPARAER